jgi:hypothetical protein
MGQWHFILLCDELPCLPSQNAEGYVSVAVYLLPSQSEIAEGYVSIAVYLCLHVYALYSPINSKSIQPNRMTFGEMIGYYPHQ